MKAFFCRLCRGLMSIVALVLMTACNGSHGVAGDSPSAAGTTNLSVPSPALSASAAVPETVEPQKLYGPTIPEPAGLSLGVKEVVTLAKGGVNDEVILAYVEKSTNSFPLSAQELLYLSDLGLAPSVITAMQRKTPAAPSPVQAAAPSGIPVTNVPPAAAPQAAPSPTVVTPTYAAPGPVPGVQPAQTVQTVQTVVTQPVLPAQPVTVNYFYDALAPHGVWVDVPGYGRCWQPNYAVLGPEWRPYVHGGRWVWTDSGWYWLSDYSWGWATFHYGRWCSAPGFGWVWYPDTVWGPSWVCWRRTGSHCGWAPLPPGAYWHAGGWYHHGRSVSVEFDFGLGAASFVFLPWGRFCDPHPTHFYANHSHVQALHRESRVMNAAFVGPNNGMIYHGPGRAQAIQASRAPIPQMSLREAPLGTRSLQGVQERVQLQNGGSVISSPRISAVPLSQPSRYQGSGRSAVAANPTPASSLGIASAPISGGQGSSGASSFGRSGFAPNGSLAPSPNLASPSRPSTVTPDTGSPAMASRAVPTSVNSPQTGIRPSLGAQPSLPTSPAISRPVPTAVAPASSSPQTALSRAPEPIIIRREAGSSLSSSAGSAAAPMASSPAAKPLAAQAPIAAPHNTVSREWANGGGSPGRPGAVATPSLSAPSEPPRSPFAPRYSTASPSMPAGPSRAGFAPAPAAPSPSGLSRPSGGYSVSPSAPSMVRNSVEPSYGSARPANAGTPSPSSFTGPAYTRQPSPQSVPQGQSSAPHSAQPSGGRRHGQP